jgi:peptidoglycan/LPS O-acetylase OafA/YrhL
MKQYPFINGLRALAVIPVILYHIGVAPWTGGFVGVDIFFVISGFLITGIIVEGLQNNSFSFVEFYERRARRILPALFVTCMITFILAMFFFMPNDTRFFARSLWNVMLFKSNFGFLGEVNYFASQDFNKPLLHTWSLAVEEQFYFLAPVYFYLLYDFFKARQQWFLFSIYALLSASLLVNLVFINSNPEAAFYLLPARAWEILTGSVIALHLRHIAIRPAAAETMSLCAVAMLGFCFFGYDSATRFPGAAAILPCAAAGLLIWSNLRHTTWVGKILSLKPLVAVGLISYGLYLYHWPLLVFWRYRFNADMTPVEVGILLAILTVISILFYVYIETPIRTKKFFATRKNLFLFSGAGMAILMAASVVSTQANGFPSRFNDAIVQYDNGIEDINQKTENCDNLTARTLNEKTICKSGMVTESRPDFLLWGDSFAGAVEPAVQAQASAHRQSGWTSVLLGCPPLLGVDRADSLNYIQCADYNETVLRLIEKHHIKNVVLVGWWEAYLLGKRGLFGSVKDSAEVSPMLRIGWVAPDGTVYQGKQALEKSLRHTVEVLQKKGIHVWIVKTVPVYNSIIPTMLAKNLYFSKDNKNLERRSQDVLENRSATDEIFSDLEKQGVSLIDPVQKLCVQGGACIPEVNGYSLYMDGTHLSGYGALWVQDIFKPFFESLK